LDTAVHTSRAENPATLIGRTIGHYKVLSKLGEGGMGVVYRAEDTKLKRPVALKFLAAHLLGNNEIKERFRREAEAAAALSHSNIAVIYEIDESDDRSFIAMEFIEGPTVGERVTEGPLKLEEVLDVSIQSAQGLQAAHERGVVHRDIKSANLMVTPEGQVKIMDFGLAQLAERSRLTETTTVLGTPSYMSPEQAMGKKTDRRTDIWSLGVVLYEMVAGKLPFRGERQEAIVYGITNEDPEPVTALRAGLPMELEWIIGKALAKEPDERYQRADELLVDLRGLKKKLESGKSTIRRSKTTSQIGVALPSAGQVQRWERRKQTMLLGIASLAVLLALAFAFTRSPIAEAPLRRFILPANGVPTLPSISPNGQHVAYLTAPMTNDGVLWVQDLDQGQPRAVFGPAFFRSGPPAWSPDSKLIAFRSRAEIKKISVGGGPAVTVCEAPGLAFTWMPDGQSIGLSVEGQLHQVPSRGGSPEPWLEPQMEGRRVMQFAFFGLEEGIDKLLYVEGRQPRDAEIFAFDRASGRHEKLAAGRDPTYALSGHVVYENIDPPGIWAVPFSVKTMKASGDPFQVAKNGERPSVALDGTLAYLEVPPSSGLAQLVWRDRKGNKLGTIGQPQDKRILNATLSPDGRRVAVAGEEDGNQDVWIHEVGRPVKTKVTTHEAPDMWPVWSPTGETIAFVSGRSGGRDLYLKNADGTGEATVLLSTPEAAEYLCGWSRDGKILLGYRMRRPGAGLQTGDIFYLKQKEDGSGYDEVPFSQTSAVELVPQLSPNGRFLAYISNESVRNEVYVQSFPQGGGRRRVSVNGGLAPRWRADGKELFYVENADTLMAVRVSVSPALTLSAPESLFSSRGLFGLLHYDVTPDGEKFVLSEKLNAEEEAPATVRVVQNWFAEFKGRQDN
jgi:serine/threonine protein kinase